MSTKTANYNITLPAQEDYYNVDIVNENNIIIDKELKRLSDTADALAPVASSGSYNDLSDKPNTGRGAAVYTINADTFEEGKTLNNYPYEEIHNCSGRVVYVGLLSDTYNTAAQESGLFLYGGSAQQGNVGIQVTSTPNTDIKLVVVDLGAFVSDESKSVIINGLA